MNFPSPVSGCFSPGIIDYRLLSSSIVNRKALTGGDRRSNASPPSILIAGRCIWAAWLHKLLNFCILSDVFSLKLLYMRSKAKHPLHLFPRKTSTMIESLPVSPRRGSEISKQERSQSDQTHSLYLVFGHEYYAVPRI